MTEEDAKTKWCPFVRTVAYTKGGTTTSAFNRLAGGHNEAERPTSFCIGSACMAWRWKVEPRAGSPAREEVEAVAGGGRIVRIAAVAEIAGNGFCGLAGPVQ